MNGSEREKEDAEKSQFCVLIGSMAVVQPSHMETPFARSYP